MMLNYFVELCRTGRRFALSDFQRGFSAPERAGTGYSLHQVGRDRISHQNLALAPLE